MNVDNILQSLKTIRNVKIAINPSHAIVQRIYG